MRTPCEIEFGCREPAVQGRVSFSPSASQFPSLIHQLERPSAEARRLREIKQSILRKIRSELKQDGG